MGPGYQLLRYCRPSAGSDSNRIATFGQKKSTPVGRTFLKKRNKGLFSALAACAENAACTFTFEAKPNIG